MCSRLITLLVTLCLLFTSEALQDPVESPAGISGVPNAVVVGEIGRPLNVRCLVFGYPKPSIYWYRGRKGSMVPYSSSLYEAKEEVLQIKKLSLETLGEYLCQAYNGRGKPAEWSFVVRAYRPDGYEDSDNLIARPSAAAATSPAPAPETTPPPPPTTHQVFVYTALVSTRIVAESEVVASGSTLSLRCEVDGYPEPAVVWTKDGQPLQPADRVTLTDFRLIVNNARADDAGEYGCEATNAYGSHRSSVYITVQGVYIPVWCVDNRFFANCNLIVKSNYCNHTYYSRFCCKSCVEAGLLDANKLQLNEPLLK